MPQCPMDLPALRASLRSSHTEPQMKYAFFALALCGCSAAPTAPIDPEIEAINAQIDCVDRHGGFEPIITENADGTISVKMPKITECKR